MSSKREREYERRRYEKWQQRQVQARARQRRQRVVAGAVVGALVLAVGIGAAVALTRDDTPVALPSPVVSDQPQATAQPARTGNGGVVPEAALAEGRTWTGTLALSQGDVAIELDGAAAPQAVANFVTLAREGYFDGTSCHRLVTGGIHVLQCGDPTATGQGGPGYSWGPVENAPSDDVYPAGTIAMARVGGDGSSMGSQFFLVYEDSQIPSDSAGGYTVFGRITSGLDVVQAIADAGTVEGSETPVDDVIIEGVETQ
ncbi:peptidylprolyl isomerase [Cellulomonas fimi]|uniref:Peptidyl-prolyl cis-trans isomerase cyclophilin type n=1 Tax=Cellulomonas fimi (strain ATCC 484 / DSM 20113 / JCM 1341 / CCUG 24087 / LMG 16345 / NBRC 15513 / NCIMB 8980 / NCTC 7547 / NRS-133) TaxID=590998 RepID=F4H0A5_CELFA|nr:peptidylprolyl isomerase [Cellulomonas fimi]AEE46152.1 peptidyl-prolyl cis-trans isomerase cyclophilin type [Cellulomonas fimi ATCC 484]NNH07061.1 peptidylprolyl isomerase [Cellulomonas fimi]VEH31842.1 Putative peptidyl-prolyl cis-trans isomerase [Cellulomonas fimi]